MQCNEIKDAELNHYLVKFLEIQKSNSAPNTRQEYSKFRSFTSCIPFIETSWYIYKTCMKQPLQTKCILQCNAIGTGDAVLGDHFVTFLAPHTHSLYQFIN